MNAGGTWALVEMLMTASEEKGFNIVKTTVWSPDPSTCGGVEQGGPDAALQVPQGGGHGGAGRHTLPPPGQAARW